MPETAEDRAKRNPKMTREEILKKRAELAEFTGFGGQTTKRAAQAKAKELIASGRFGARGE